jgi:aldehyde dehydrogenase (NAD+)
MYEQWHPLGTVGIITAFNFPVAVWAWNAMIAAVCGDAMIWKPSSKVPLCAIATHKVILPVLQAHNCPGIMNLAVGKGSTFGSWMLKDKRIPLISATGSCNMGRKVGAEVGARLGRHILELGGNNAMIIAPSANMENALRAICFGAIGTAGQRCTSTRRVFLHEQIYDNMLKSLKAAYESVKIGDPLDSKTLVGPLIDKDACSQYLDAVKKAREQGGTVVTGGELYNQGECAKGTYVRPTLIEATMDMPIVREETFAPILYVFKYKDINEAIRMQNDVDQGLSSAVFTNNLLESETFLSHQGSDCGIANVNIGTSGAEIGLAFGGEKDTGGGREAGSDAWKQYMRRQANTINFGTDLPLAQGVSFDI